MFLLLSACFVVQGDGDTTSEPREVTGVTSLAANDVIDVHHVHAESASAVLICDANLLDHIRTTVEDGELVVESEPGVSINPRGECTLDLAAPCLDSFTATGSGDIWSDVSGCDVEAVRATGSGDVSLAGAAGARLEAKGTGSGHIELGALQVERLEVSFTGSGGGGASGVCGTADVELTGSGDFDGRDLSCAQAEIRTTGSGDVELTVTGHAEVTTTGSGDVDLWGGGTVDASTSGSGDVTTH